MSIERIKFANGKTLRVIDGEYVIGAGGACKEKSCLKGDIIKGEYWVDNCMQKYNCSCKDFRKWYNENVQDWSENYGIARCEEITIIELEEYNLTSIPESICAFKNAIQLELYNNKLTDLPDSIAQLNLTEIGAGYNSFSFIPKCVTKIKTLKNLYLGDNKITSIPAEIGNLKNLEILDLEYNFLTKISEKIGNLTKLKTLELSSNNLSFLPYEMHNLDNDAIEIFLYNNNFTDEYKDYIRNNLFPVANANKHLLI